MIREEEQQKHLRTKIRLEQALREIANRAGTPTMSYCSEIVLTEQRNSLDWIAGRAADALKGDT